jgi:hypothetical protein
MTAQAYPGPPLSPSRVGSDDPRCRAHPEEHRDMCRACARISVDVERERAATIGAKGRGLWRFSALTAGVLFGGPIELETRGNLMEWMVMSESERIEALAASWSDGLRRQREMAGEGPPPSRQARTSLGFGLFGQWAPPDGRWQRRTFALSLPDGRAIEIVGGGSA